MIGTPSAANPRAFVNARLDEAVGAVVAVIREIRPHVVITYDPNGGYGHPDHIQAHAITTAAVEAAGTPAYPETGEPWSTPKFYWTVTERSGLERGIAAISEFPENWRLPEPGGIAERRGHRRADGNRRSRRHRCEGEGIERPRHSGDGSPEPSRVRIVEQRGPTDPDGRAFRIGRRARSVRWVRDGRERDLFGGLHS